MKISAKCLARKARFEAISARIEARAAADLGESQFNSHPRHQHGNKPKRRSSARATYGPTPEELHWRQSVLLRDGHQCVNCGSDQHLEADHIKPKSLYPDLKYEIANGRTLCKPCHQQTETYGGKVKRLAGVEVADV